MAAHADFEPTRITVVREFKEPNHHQRMAECICFCGKSFTATLSKVSRAHTRSCGCLRVRTSVALLTTHGRRGTREYRAWQAMKTRCNNPNAERFKNYGGRGITICGTWLDSFETFYSDMGNCPEGLTLDRIDVNKGYTKENCRWATWAEQARNKTNSKSNKEKQ